MNHIKSLSYLSCVVSLCFFSVSYSQTFNTPIPSKLKSYNSENLPKRVVQLEKIYSSISPEVSFPLGNYSRKNDSLVIFETVDKVFVSDKEKIEYTYNLDNILVYKNYYELSNIGWILTQRSNIIHHGDLSYSENNEVPNVLPDNWENTVGTDFLYEGQNISKIYHRIWNSSNSYWDTIKTEAFSYDAETGIMVQHSIKDRLNNQAAWQDLYSFNTTEFNRTSYLITSEESSRDPDSTHLLLKKQYIRNYFADWRILQEIIREYNEVSSTWQFSQKCIYIYDLKQNLEQKTFFSYFGSTWQYDEKHAYYYDNNNKLSRIEKEKWVSQWIPCSQYNYSVIGDTSRFQIKMAEETYDGETNYIYKITVQKDSIFNPAGQLSEIKDYAISDSSQYFEYARIYNNYDTSGNWTGCRVTSVYNEFTGSQDENFILQLKYDSSNRITEHIESVFDEILNNYRPYLIETASFDTAGNEITYMFKSLNEEDNIWYVDEYTIREFNLNNQLIKEILFEGDSINPKDSISYFYNPDGTLQKKISEIIYDYNWDGIYDAGGVAEYQYNSEKKPIEIILYHWNEDSSGYFFNNKTSLTYDEEGRKSIVLISVWDQDSLKYSVRTRESYSYTSFDSILAILIERKKIFEWDTTELTEYSYSLNHYLTGIEKKRNTFVNKQYFIRNDNNLISEKVELTYYEPDTIPNKGYREVFQYDQFNNLITHTLFSIDEEFKPDLIKEIDCGVFIQINSDNLFLLDQKWQYFWSKWSQPCDFEIKPQILTAPSCFDSQNASIQLNRINAEGIVTIGWEDSPPAEKYIYESLAGNKYYHFRAEDESGCVITDSIYLPAPDPISVIIESADTDPGSNNGTTEAIVSGGSEPYIYYWTSGHETNQVDSLSAGTYQVKVTDNNGCVQQASAFINDRGGPVINITSLITPLCNNSSDGCIDISVIGEEPFKYRWSGGSTLEDLCNVNAGIYEIHVTDKNGLVGIKEIVLNAPEKIQINSYLTEPGCGMNNGMIELKISGGLTPYQIKWSDDKSDIIRTDLVSGIYQVEIMDQNGCSLTKIIPLEDAGAPRIKTDLICLPECGLQNGQIQISVTSPSGNLQYQWSAGPESEDRTGLSPGLFDLNVTDTETGCKSFLSFDLPQQIPTEPEICLVTVDSLTGMNQVVWEKEYREDLDHYNIYRESNVKNVYTKIAEVQYTSESLFTDTEANSMVRSYRYRISAVDTCGSESLLSTPHKTIHLSMNIGLNGVINLLWDPYEGFNINSYLVWRYTESSGWVNIAAVPGNLQSYTDTEVPDEKVTYFIEAPHPTGCYITKKAKNLSSSRSNRTYDKRQKYSGPDYNRTDLQSWKVFPNPTDGKISLIPCGTFNGRFDLQVNDISGRPIFLQQLKHINEDDQYEIDLASFKNGIYILEIHGSINDTDYIRHFKIIKF